ncbi:helix-turn-helix transcriptional regulator [Salmonella enterica]|nr:hypothetical protein [Salmonella enterica]
MLLISNDNFFVSGIRELIAGRCFSNSCELMILDAPPFIYILDIGWFLSKGFKDPVTTLLCCSDFLYPRELSVNDFINALHNNKMATGKSLSERVTTSELKVLHAVCNGDKDKNIAKRFNCSEKTVNSHKINVLNKMKIKNSRTLYVLVYFWKTSWLIHG